MSVFSFFGHPTAFGSASYLRLLQLLETLVQNEPKIDFRFFDTDTYPTYAMGAAWQMQQLHPEKAITLTWVICSEIESQVLLNEVILASPLPPYSLNRVMRAPINCGLEKITREHVPLVRQWLANSSDLIIACGANSPEDRATLKTAQEAGARVIDFIW